MVKTMKIDIKTVRQWFVLDINKKVHNGDLTKKNAGRMGYLWISYRDIMRYKGTYPHVSKVQIPGTSWSF